MTTTTSKIITNAAKREGKNESEIIVNKQYSKFRDRVNEVETSQNIFTPGKVYIYIVSLTDFPISLQDFRELKRDDIRATHGFYTIQYIPSGSVKRNPKFPYLIGQDLVRIRVTVSGPKHWSALCSRVPELGWLKRNSTLCDAMFAIAKKHPGLVLRFGIDFPKYCEKIENRANELGIDIDHKPLVTYQWGANNVPDVSAILTKNDKSTYAEVLKSVQSNIDKEEEI